MSTRSSFGRPASVAVAGSALLLAGCTAAPEPTGVSVLASFYPLQLVVEQVGGDRVDVSALTPPLLVP